MPYKVLMTLNLNHLSKSVQTYIHQNLEERNWEKVSPIHSTWVITKSSRHRNLAVRDCIVDLQNCKDILGLSTKIPWAAQVAEDHIKEGEA